MANMDTLKVSLYMIFFKLVLIQADPQCQKDSVGSDLMFSKFGKCSLARRNTLDGMCRSLLFKPYRKNLTGKSCSTQFPLFVNCSIAIYSICLDGICTEKQIAARSASVATSKHHEKPLLCNSGGVNRKIPSGMTQSCNKSIDSEYKKCFKPFFQLFDNNRGSTQLCEALEASNECVINALQDYCNKTQIEATLDLAKALLSRRANSFCSPEQGGGNPYAILSGDMDSKGEITTTSTFIIIYLCIFVNAFLHPDQLYI